MIQFIVFLINVDYYWFCKNVKLAFNKYLSQYIFEFSFDIYYVFN